MNQKNFLAGYVGYVRYRIDVKFSLFDTVVYVLLIILISLESASLVGNWYNSCMCMCMCILFSLYYNVIRCLRCVTSATGTV